MGGGIDMNHVKLVQQARDAMSTMYWDDDISVEIALECFKLIQSDVDHYVSSLEDDIEAKGG